MTAVVHNWTFPTADDQMAREMKPTGEYQRSNLDGALRYVTDWSLAIDGGAHVGTWSRPMAAKFARVIACEPTPDTYTALCINMRAFGCTNVETKPVALGRAVGAVTMTLPTKAIALHNSGARYAAPGFDVPVEPIDGWFLPSCGFLKLDVEGSELFALEGARQTIKRCRPIILFEDKALWAKHFGLPKLAVRDFLEHIGYVPLARVSHDEIWGPR